MQLTKVIDSDFCETGTSDFRIECACSRKAFHVHNVVLGEYTYFESLIRAHWQEGQSGFAKLPEREDVVRMLLCYLYGMSVPALFQVAKDLHADMALTTEELLPNPEDLPAVIPIDLAEYETAAQVVHSPWYLARTTDLVELCIAAEKYMIEDLSSEICKHLALSTTFRRSFGSPRILQLIRLVHENTMELSPVRLIFCGRIIRMLDLLYRHQEFRELLHELSDLAISLVPHLVRLHETPHGDDFVVAGSAFCNACFCNVQVTRSRCLSHGQMLVCENHGHMHRAHDIYKVRQSLWTEAQLPPGDGQEMLERLEKFRIGTVWDEGSWELDDKAEHHARPCEINMWNRIDY